MLKWICHHVVILWVSNNFNEKYIWSHHYNGSSFSFLHTYLLWLLYLVYLSFGKYVSCKQHEARSRAWRIHSTNLVNYLMALFCQLALALVCCANNHCHIAFCLYLLLHSPASVTSSFCTGHIVFCKLCFKMVTLDIWIRPFLVHSQAVALSLVRTRTGKLSEPIDSCLWTSLDILKFSNTNYLSSTICF